MFDVITRAKSIACSGGLRESRTRPPSGCYAREFTKGGLCKGGFSNSRIMITHKLLNPPLLNPPFANSRYATPGKAVPSGIRDLFLLLLNLWVAIFCHN